MKTRSELEKFEKAGEYYFGKYSLTDYMGVPDWYINLLLLIKLN
jgi:hypothetical protein